MSRPGHFPFSTREQRGLKCSLTGLLGSVCLWEDPEGLEGSERRREATEEAKATSHEGVETGWDGAKEWADGEGGSRLSPAGLDGRAWSPGA